MSQESLPEPWRKVAARRQRNKYKIPAYCAAVFLAVGGATAAEIIIHEPIEAAKAPARLPRPVRAEQASAVKVNFGPSPKISWQNSGEKIGPNLVLTTGRAVLYKNSKDKMACKDSFTINRFSIPGHEDQITAQKVIDNSHGDTTGEDLAVLRVRPSAAFARLPTGRLATSSPTTGSTVYFVNYEAGPGSQEDRYPNAAEAQQYDGNNYGHAAEYAGTVVSRKGGYYLIATGEKDYNPSAHAISSYNSVEGSPIFTQNGRTFAVDTGSEYTEKASDVSYNYRVTLPFPSNTMVQLEIAQPTTPQLVDALIESLRAEPAGNVC